MLQQTNIAVVVGGAGGSVTNGVVVTGTVVGTVVVLNVVVGSFKSRGALIFTPTEDVPIEDTQIKPPIHFNRPTNSLFRLYSIWMLYGELLHLNKIKIWELVQMLVQYIVLERRQKYVPLTFLTLADTC